MYGLRVLWILCNFLIFEIIHLGHCGLGTLWTLDIEIHGSWTLWILRLLNSEDFGSYYSL